MLDELGETIVELDESPGSVMLLDATQGLGTSPSDEELRREAVKLPSDNVLRKLFKVYNERLIKV